MKIVPGCLSVENIKGKYEELIAQYSIDYQALNKRYNLFGFLRFLVIIALITLLIYFFKTDKYLFLFSAIAALIGFIFMIKIHSKLSFNRKFTKTLIEINKNELAYINRENIPFDDGTEYIDSKHAYSFDLDFFGKDSLYQNLNRTATYIGKTKLSALLQNHLSNKDIVQNQNAIKELSGKIELRQAINAIAIIANDHEDVYKRLISWLSSGQGKSSFILQIFSFASPLALLVLITLYFTDGSVVFRTLATTLFLTNIAVLIFNIKAIKRELISSTKIDEIIKNYSLIIKSIESETFEADKLNHLKSKLKSKSALASQQIEKLSSLFSQLDSLFNLIGAFITNGLALYHLHVFRNLMKWKSNHQKYVAEWMDVLGEFETLGSLANFSYNNPLFIFPDLNDEKLVEIHDLGHPLIDPSARINNSVDFCKQSFIILTGSNMSGKSTFLRSLGVNMVLAGIGSVICASQANINPLKVWVSMRLSDSLEDNESYFFVEVKRLKEIMDNSEKETTFILLDEILRGTNSEDKHIGTVEVIKKLISKGAVGAIATHDLKVCLTSDNYPETLVNKCFEVEIINNDLYFDYKLRDGICKNKSATFLMEKMEVI